MEEWQGEYDYHEQIIANRQEMARTELERLPEFPINLSHIQEQRCIAVAFESGNFRKKFPTIQEFESGLPWSTRPGHEIKTKPLQQVWMEMIIEYPKTFNATVFLIDLHRCVTWELDRNELHKKLGNVMDARVINELADMVLDDHIGEVRRLMLISVGYLFDNVIMRKCEERNLEYLGLVR